MPIFGCINSLKKTIIFALVTTIAFALLILIGFSICSWCGVNQIIGIILGMLVGIALLWFVYDQKGNDFLSSKDRYHIVKIQEYKK